LDYGAGNVRSVINALKSLGCNVKTVQSIKDIENAQRLLFPGVGAYGQAMDALKTKGYTEALRDYVGSGRPFLGICLGLQLLFEGSEENGGVELPMSCKNALLLHFKSPSKTHHNTAATLAYWCALVSLPFLA